jgi:hypothetical protein
MLEQYTTYQQRFGRHLDTDRGGTLVESSLSVLPSWKPKVDSFVYLAVVIHSWRE